LGTGFSDGLNGDGFFKWVEWGRLLAPFPSLVGNYLTSRHIFFSARSRRTSKCEKFQRALISDLIINVKYRSFWVILEEIKSALSAQKSTMLLCCDTLSTLRVQQWCKN
jgi:hypothetical protein